MKKSLIFASALLAVVALSSCSSSVTISNYPSAEVVPETMIVNMTVADLKVQPEKVSATTSWSWNPFKNVSGYENIAVAEALKQTNADLLLNPVYEVKENGPFKGGSITVTGNPAYYTNFRPLTMKEAIVINILKGNNAVATPVVSTTAPSLLDKFASGSNFDEADLQTYNFANILFGFSGAPEFSGSDISLMYGHVGKSWGWYSKLDIGWGSRQDDEGIKGGFAFTGGAVKTLPSNFAFFFGAGLGMTPNDKKFAFPMEVGAMWRYHHVNFMLGFQEQFSSNCTSMPFIGVGYCF